jgi:lipoyl(octanoyl) transferase
MLTIIDAGLLPYRPAWDLQLQLHDKVLAGEKPYAPGILMLVEHPPTITIGRRPNAAQHLLASPALLASRGIDLVETDRGGDITFHGPGQLVAYPIIPLNPYNFNLHSYMRFLEEVVIQTLASFHLPAHRDPSPKPATGVWVPLITPDVNPKPTPETPGGRPEPATPRPCPIHAPIAPSSPVAEARGCEPPAASPSAPPLAKICALGIKLRRWITLHGIALNVSTDLSFFQLINPCGLSRPVTSMQTLLADQCPPMSTVKDALTHTFQNLLPPHGNDR